MEELLKPDSLRWKVDLYKSKIYFLEYYACNNVGHIIYKIDYKIFLNILLFLKSLDGKSPTLGSSSQLVTFLSMSQMLLIKRRIVHQTLWSHTRCTGTII